jgi:hypothetical protein
MAADRDRFLCICCLESGVVQYQWAFCGKGKGDGVWIGGSEIPRQTMRTSLKKDKPPLKEQLSDIPIPMKYDPKVMPQMNYLVNGLLTDIYFIGVVTWGCERRATGVVF